LTTGAEGVASWIQGKVDQLKAVGDVAGAKKLMRSLREVVELKLQEED